MAKRTHGRGGKRRNTTPAGVEARGASAQLAAPDVLSEANVLGEQRVTRRELLGGATALAAGALVAGCSLPFVSQAVAPFKLTRPATVAFDATVPAAVQAPLVAQIKNVAGIPTATVASSIKGADLVITFGALPSGYNWATIGASPLALVTHLRVPIDEVTAAQAQQLLAGQATDWKTVGAPASLPVKLLALGGLALPAGLQLAASATAHTTLDDLLTALRAQPGGLAAAPMDAADWTVRNLGVDGVYPAQGRGDATKGGAGMLTLQVGAAKSLVQQGLDVKAVAAALAPALAPVATVDMVAAGDIMLGRSVNAKMVAVNDYTFPYKGMHDELQSADYRVANLECTVTDLVQPPSDPTTFTFITSKKAVTGLQYGGFNAVTVANNHSAGPGKAALLDMVATLHSNNIAVTGGGGTLAEAAAPAITTVKGTRVAILGYLDDVDSLNPNARSVKSSDQNNTQGIPSQGQSATESSWGYSKVLLSTLASDIAAARQQADIVIPYFHWGHEFEGGNYPYKVWKRQVDVSHAAIDAGADMVLGNHPHVTQGIENYKGKLIVYSMGNFIFDQYWSRETREGVMIHLYWRAGALIGIRFVPTLEPVAVCQPAIMTPTQAVGVMGRLWQSTDLIAAGQYDTTVWEQPVP